MSYELPGMAVDALNFIGLPWPAIDEDQLHGWAGDVRTFVTEITQISQMSRTAVQSLKDGNESSFVRTLADNWDRYHSEITALKPALDVFADALDIAADAVLAQKIVVSGAVVALAVEIIATQGEAVFTLGLAEGEIPVEVALTKQAVKFALQELENKLIGYLINEAADRLTTQIGTSATKMLMGGVNVAFEAQSLQMDFGALGNIARTAGKYRNRTETVSMAAKRKSSSREVETSETGGRWHVVEILLAALKSIAEDIFAKLPGVLHTVLGDLEKDLKNAEAVLKKADQDLATHAPHTDGPSPLDTAAPAAVAAVPAVLGGAKGDGDTPIFHVADDGSITRLGADGSKSPLTDEDKTRLGLKPSSIGRPKPQEEDANLMGADVRSHPRPKAASEAVPAGGSDLAKATQLARHSDKSYGNTRGGVFKSNNYAAARVEGANGKGDFIIVGRSNGYRHSERNIGIPFLRQDDATRVKEMYSERAPCATAPNCEAWLGERFPHTKVTYSFPYGTTREQRLTDNETVKSYLEWLRNNR